MKKATVDNLIKLGVDSQSKRHGTIEVKSLGLSFEYDKMPIMAMVDLIDEYEDSTSGQLQMAMELIYMTIPIFRSKELQEQFNVVEPHDIVLKVLGDNIKVVTELAQEITKLYNFEGLIDDVKK